MSVQIAKKILSVVGLAALAVMPVQETAYARSMTGGGTGSAAVSISGGYGSSLVPGGYQYTMKPVQGAVTGGSSTSAGGRVITGGGATGGSQVNGGASGGYGSSLVQGGYQFNPNNTPGGASGSSSNGRVITGGGSAGGSQVSGGTSGGYGSSLVPGGYQFDPNNTPGGREVAGGGSSNSSNGRVITGGGATGGSQVSGGTSGGYGSSLVPGGYQFDPNNTPGGREITGGNGSSGPTGGREITGGNASGGDREIVGGVVDCGYGSSLVPGGYQYCPHDDNDDNNNDDNGDVTPVEENTYYACEDDDETIYVKVTREDGEYTIRLYDEGDDKPYFISDEMDEDDVEDFLDDKEDDGYDCDRISKSEFEDGIDDEDDDVKYYACEHEDNDEDTIYIKLTEENGDEYTIRKYREGDNGSYAVKRNMDKDDVDEFFDDLEDDDYDCDRISKSEFEDGIDDDNRSECRDRDYPDDIDGHWAEIYVRRLYDLCVTEGYDDGSFRPNQYVTRAELVKMGLYANGLEPNDGCYDNDCGSPYRDLDEWQGPWIRTAYDHDIVEGYANDKFYPNRYITRAEAVKVVLATYGYRPLNVSESFFNDVSGWSTGWIERARVIGLVQGIGNGNFDPDRPITRAEAAKVIVKMIEHWDTEIK